VFDSRQFGIEHRGDLLKGSFDFDLLLLSEQTAISHKVCELELEADKRRAQLPHRIVIAESKNELSTELCAVSSRYIDLRERESVILDVYDEWIKFLIKRTSLPACSLSLYFEGLHNAAQQWRGVEAPPYLTEIASISGGVTPISENKRSYAKTINLWRHISLFGDKSFWEEVIKNARRSNIFYFQECSYSDPFFSYLSSLNAANQHFQQRYLLRQILEMSICRVVVIDERIAQTVGNRTKENYANRLSAPTLAWMGIWIIGSIKFRKDGQDVAVINLYQQQGIHEVLPVMTIDYKGGAFHSFIEQPAELEQFFPPAPDKIEILTIHQTILDGRFKQVIMEILEGEIEYGNELLEHWILEMKKGAVLFVFSHSGRGHPGELLPKNSPFLDYSFLQTHLLSQPSKFFFVQLALGSRRRAR
jgi:hypothetical protein